MVPQMYFRVPRTRINTPDDVLHVLKYALQQAGMQPRCEVTSEERYPWRLFFSDYEGEKSILLPYHMPVRPGVIAAKPIKWPSQLGCLISEVLWALGNVNFQHDGQLLIVFGKPNTGVVMKLAKDHKIA